MEALADTAHKVVAYDWRGGAPDERLLCLARSSDAVFLALHGGDGEGGALQGALDQAGIFHYTGSDARGAALALDKAKAKQCVSAAGVPVAEGAVWQGGKMPQGLPFPVIVKPLFGGSSVGLKKIESAADLIACKISEPLLVEEFLGGREFTVGVLNGAVLPVIEIIPNGGTYDYKHKYTAGATRELCPAPIEKEKAEHLKDLALRAFRALGLRDFARMDFKENAKGQPYFLEANTLPGLTRTSLLPLAATTAGLPFATLCEQMASLAATRKNRP